MEGLIIIVSFVEGGMDNLWRFEWNETLPLWKSSSTIASSSGSDLWGLVAMVSSDEVVCLGDAGDDVEGESILRLRPEPLAFWTSWLDMMQRLKAASFHGKQLLGNRLLVNWWRVTEVWWSGSGEVMSIQANVRMVLNRIQESFLNECCMNDWIKICCFFSTTHAVNSFSQSQSLLYVLSYGLVLSHAASAKHSFTFQNLHRLRSVRSASERLNIESGESKSWGESAYRLTSASRSWHGSSYSSSKKSFVLWSSESVKSWLRSRILSLSVTDPSMRLGMSDVEPLTLPLLLLPLSLQTSGPLLFCERRNASRSSTSASSKSSLVSLASPSPGKSVVRTRRSLLKPSVLAERNVLWGSLLTWIALIGIWPLDSVALLEDFSWNQKKRKNMDILQTYNWSEFTSKKT